MSDFGPDLTLGELRYVQHEMALEPDDDPTPEIGECLRCGKQYVVTLDEDGEPLQYCSPVCLLLDMVKGN